MAELNLDPNIGDADAFYSTLIAAHEGLTDDESNALNARLILVLANQIGDPTVLHSAIETAKAP